MGSRKYSAAIATRKPHGVDRAAAELEPAFVVLRFSGGGRSTVSTGASFMRARALPASGPLARRPASGVAMAPAPYGLGQRSAGRQVDDVVLAQVDEATPSVAA